MHESTEKKQVGNKDRTQITQITQFFVLYKATDIDLKKCWIKIPKEDLLKTHPLWENKEMRGIKTRTSLQQSNHSAQSGLGNSLIGLYRM